MSAPFLFQGGMKLRNKFKPVMAVFLAVLTLLGVMPFNIMANESVTENATTVYFMGEEATLELGADGLFHVDADTLDVDIETLGNQTEFALPPYVYIDGERVPIDSDRILNITPVISSSDEGSLFTPFGIIPVSASAPPITAIFHIDQDDTWDSTVSMTMSGRTRTVSPRRYVAMISGLEYEIFCADPTLPGPADGNAVYETSGEDTIQSIRNVLRYGFPVNPFVSAPTLDNNTRVWNAYITRVAIAMANNPSATFTGDSTTLTAAQNLVNNNIPGEHLNFETLRPAIEINGEQFASDFAGAVGADAAFAQSDMFSVTHNRRTNAADNPFYFEWAAGTPAGSRLIVNGQTFTHPDIPTERFRGEVDFRLEMPNTAENRGQEAMVYLVGMHNEFAGRVWRLQHPTNPSGWQDMVLYIPYVRSSAAFSFEPIEGAGNLRIIKRNPSGQGLAGAVFQITGPDGFNVQMTTPANGIIFLAGLEPGAYTVTETVPPPGYSLSSPTSRNVNIQAGVTEAVEIVFVNHPQNGNGNGIAPMPLSTEVRIQKICALGRNNIPGAMMRLVGMTANYVTLPDGQTISFNNTGINLMQVLTAGATTAVQGDVTSTVADGVWTLEGLPFGFYMVYEYRAPDGYSLLPSHTARGFWLAPPNVSVNISQPDLNISGTGNESSWNVDWSLGDSSGNMGGGGDPEAGWNAEGTITIPGDSMAPPEFEIIEMPNPSSVLITFENYPFSEIVVYKRAINNGVEGDFLSDATFRIQGFFVEGNAPQIIDMVGVTDANGRLVFRGLPAGNYTITELQAPAGFMRNYPYHRSVNVSWGQLDGHPSRPAPSVVFFNTPKSSLEIHKVCANTGANLSGAVFEISDPVSGETWEATTGADGRAIFGQGGNFLYPDRTYIVREIVAPLGFVLNSTPREVVLTPGDNNVITWTNYHNPSLTIIKRDAADHRLLAGAVFDVTFENGQPIAGSPFTTDAQGRIVIPEILGDNEFERTVIVTETAPPPGYNLATPNWQRVVIRAGEDNVITFDNERMPTLTIQKIDARTGYPVQGAWFEIEYLGATAGTGTGNIGQSGMLTGNPFITDNNGRIIIESVYSGRYRIREIRAADNYWLTPLEANRTWIIEVRDNEDYTLVVENTLLPTLVITKRNALTWRPIPMTQFRVEYEVPNSPHVQHIGYFMTNMQGQIILPFVQVGWYRVTETRPAFGMTLATNNNFRVFLQPGDNSYALIREGIIASESMIAPMVETAPEICDEPAFEPCETDREYLQRGSSVIENAPTPDIPNDVDMEAIEPDMDAFVDEEFTPEASEAPIIYTNFPDDFFERIDIENIEINLYDNPQLAVRMSSNLQVWGGDQFWNNDLGVWNFPQNSLVIRKENAVTGELLQGATFSVTQISSGNDSGLAGTIIGHFITNHSGIIVIAGLDPGYFLVEETIPPDNFTLSTNNRQHAFLRPDGTSIVEMTFSNLPYSSLIITLRCSVTSAPIPNGEFRVTNSAGAVVGTDNGHFWTNLQGEILIPNVVPDSYVITQVTVPSLFVIDLVQSTQTIRVNPTGQIYRVDFFSDPLSQLLITLRCEVTGQPIQGGEFRVTNSAGNVVGSANGIFFTNLQGEIIIPNLGVDSYVVTQLNAPAGFRLGSQNSQTIFVQRPAETYALHFTNEPYSGLIIQNLDGYNGDPLPGVRFRIDRINDSGNVFIGEHVTDNNGRIELTGLLGSFNITQIDVPNGWEFDAQPIRIAQVNTGVPTLVTFHSPRMGSLEITLTDEDGNPLSGGRFEVRRQNGLLIGEFVTPVSGMVNLPNLGSGWFTVEQIAAPQGFVMTNTGRSVEVTTNTVARANFVNIQSPSLVIEKVCTDGTPLAGAEFEVRTLAGTLIHRGTTNNGGIISIARLEPGAFIITETRAPQGFVITEPSRVVEIVAGQTLTERFVNHRAPALVIEKVCEQGNPLAGAEFDVRRLNGEIVVRGVTNVGGLFIIDALDPGAYEVIETRAPIGFVITEPSRAIQITAGQTVTERFINLRQPSLTIEKVDEGGNPLAGAEFEIRRPSGELVHRGVTNNGGIISIPNLEPGTFIIEETRAPQGFVITEVARTVEFVAGQSRTERFVNHRAPSLIVEKVDTDGNPLAGAEFEIRRLNGELVVRGVTNIGGLFIVDALDPGVYEIVETRAPQGFVITEPSRAIQVTAGQTLTERFVNHRAPALVIEKVCEQGNPLAGAEFEIRRLNGELVHRVVTNQGGMAVIDVLDPGAYEVIETRAPEGFAIVEPSRAIQVVAGETLVERFVNPRLATFVIHKIDGDTNEPLQGVIFEITTLAGERIRNPQNGSFEFITDNAGMIRLPMLEAGSYVAVETRPLLGYMAAEPIPFIVGHDRDYIITVRNFRYPDINIRKIDGNTQEPLAGVQFEIARYFANGRIGERLRNPVDGSFIWTTDRAGIIRIPNLEHGTFIATEIRPLPGYMLADPVIFVVDNHHPTTITIHNYRYSEWNILKLDGHTNQPLQGVVFEVAVFHGSGTTGERIRNAHNGSFEFISDAAGIARIGALEPGTYIITETRPLDGFMVAEPVIINVTGREVDTTVTIRNYRYSEWNILKLDGDTNQPLQGVVFEIAPFFGTGIMGERLRNPENGTFEFVSDAAGLVRIGALQPGTYVITETRALPGFRVAEPVIITVTGNEVDTTVIIRNYRDAQLTIRKINSLTRTPLEGVIFEISRPDGTRLINPRTGFHDFVTDRNGLIFLPVIEDGRFYLRETRALPGFIVDEEVIAFNIDASARQREHVLVVENTPAAGLLVVVTDSQTGRPLEGIEIEVRQADGRIVTGQMLDGNQPNTPSNSPQLAANGNFLTDSRGRVNLNHLAPGVYHVRVQNTARGFQSDTDIHVVTVVAGQQAVLEIQIAPLAGLRLYHFDAITQAPIFNVEFMVFDHNGMVVGNFYTDNMGIIDFSAILVPGRYTIRMTRPARGYHHDDVPRTVEFIAGKVTEIRWEAIPIAGQLQLLVVSGANNEQNALPAGTPLSGAVFEIFSERTGNLVDRIISTERGMAVSRPLPLGRYYAVMVAAPPFYMINPQKIPFEIEFASQIVRFTFPILPANTGVSINVTGQREVMQGHNIFYDIRTIRNDSTIPLGDFYWRVQIPTNAVRADRLVTGTFNHSLRYTITARTNLGNSIVVADNLMSTRNNVVELRPVHLGLANDEYLIEITVFFGQVPAGFTAVEIPRLHVDVLSERQAFLPNGMMFALKADIGGRVPGSDEWVIGNDTWATTLFSPSRPLPRSGF